MSNFLETYTTKIKTWANGKFCTDTLMQQYVDVHWSAYKQNVIDDFVASLPAEIQAMIEADL
jgi:hypothetical protein